MKLSATFVALWSVGMVTIERFAYTRWGVLGSLQYENVSCRTLELPWKNNETNESCIPEGVYNTINHDSPTFGKCFWVQGVPQRSEILIHPANWISQLDGCVAVGDQYDFDCNKNLFAVWNSKDTLNRLLNTLPSEFDLHIYNWMPEWP